MAMLVLFSTVSFSVDIHFCGDTLVDYSLFDDSADCGMKLLSDSQEKCPMSLMKCCTDEEISQVGQDELATSFHSFDLEQQQFLLAFTYAYIAFLRTPPQQNVPFSHYSPPLITYDRQVIWETFLI
ncbi:MAG: hypothetical protein HKN89_09415 [Eudoraea sp.]|nr:hypothetical protein [Eudoraea sp.]